MGNFESDTRVEGGDGRYRAEILKAWDIWGPNGGYVAAIALRAAGAEARIARPAGFAAHYLSVARFAPVDLEVVPLRRGRKSESFRVSMTQEGKPVMEAIVRTGAHQPGLLHDTTRVPEAPPPESLKPSDEVYRRDAPVFPFWENIEERLTDPRAWRDEDPPKDPRHVAWYRFRPQPTFDDPFVEAARSLLLIDTMIWPAACYYHRGQRDFIAPNLDVSASFHRPGHDSGWLLCESEAPIAEGGLMGGSCRVWNDKGRLLASGGAQLMCVPVTA
jgi:acyl-CoA thioesterase II